MAIQQVSAFDEVLNNTGFEWGFFTNETWLGWNGMSDGDTVDEVTSTDKYSGVYSAILNATNTGGSGYGNVEKFQGIKGYETTTNVTNVSFLYKIVESTGDSYVLFYVDDGVWPPTGGERKYFDDCNWTRVVYDVSALDPTSGPWTVHFGVSSGDSGGSITALFDDITTNGTTPTPPSPTPTPTPTPIPTPTITPFPTPTPTPTPAYSDGLYWQIAAAGVDFGGGLMTWAVHDYKLWVFDPQHKTIYNSEDGFNYTLVVSDPDPWNATLNPEYGYRFFPEVTSHNGKIYVVGSMYYTHLLNDTWSSIDGITWEKLNDNLWNTTESRISFGLTSFKGSLVATGGDAFPGVSPSFGTFTSTNGTVWVEANDTWLLYETSLATTDDAIYALIGQTYLYTSTNGYDWTYVSTPSLTTGTRGSYGGTNLIENYYLQSYDDMLWLFGAGYSNGYKSSNNGITWVLDRQYTEYPGSATTGIYIVYDGLLLPESVFSYDGNNVWVGGYLSRADFWATPLHTTEGATVYFVDNSANEPTSWLWTFGDGGTSTDQYPTHIYTLPGTYTVTLTATNEFGSDSETKTNYITVEEGAVAFTGHVYNASDMTTISGADVYFMHNLTAIWENTTTNATGGYLYDYIFDTGCFTAFANMSGYLPYPVSFEVFDFGMYEVDLYLIPDYIWNGTGIIGGFVYDEVWGTAIPNATVVLWNSTYNETNTTTASGLYLFYNVTNSTYYVNASWGSPYDDPSDTFEVEGNTTAFVQQDIPLSPNYYVEFQITDCTTGLNISTNTTIGIYYTNGTLATSGSTYNGTWNSGLMDYGTYEYTVTCSGYSPVTQDLYLYENQTITFCISTASPTPTYSTVSYTTQHEVRFVIQDKYGNPLPDTWVTITPTNTTLGNWSWINDVFGYPPTIYINNSTMSGQCDYVGGCDFLMLKETRYLVNIQNATSGVNQNYYLFPKDELYVFTVGTTETAVANTTVGAGINWTLTNTTINSTHENLTFTFSDPSNLTSNLSFWVKTQTSPVTTCYQTYCTNPCSASESYIVESTSGTGVIWGFDAVNPELGNFTDSATITFRKLVDLGIAPYYYGWIAAAFLIVLGGFFSVINVRFGAVIIPCFAYFLWWMEWITLGATTASILAVLLIVAAISYIRKSENKQ